MSTMILRAIADGVLLGGVYGLVAVGLTLIFGVMQIVNFAHGALLMLGMYITYWAFTIWGVNPYLTVFLSIVVLFIVGVLIQKFLLTPILKAPQHNQLLLTMAIMIFLENLALLLWTPDFRSINLPSLQQSLEIGPVILSWPKILAFVLTLIITTALYLLLKYTELGRSIRATAQERDGAKFIGINVSKVNVIAFGLGSACAGVAGSLIMPFYVTSPGVGSVFLLRAFVVAILGGLGNIAGALAAGIIIGVAEAIGAVLLPGSYKDMVIYILFVIILLFRPTGLFGEGN